MNSTLHYAKLYPQNDDRIVAIYFVTSFRPICISFNCDVCLVFIQLRPSQVRRSSVAARRWHGLLCRGVWLVRAESLHHQWQQRRFRGVGKWHHPAVVVPRRHRWLSAVRDIQSRRQMWIHQHARVRTGSLQHPLIRVAYSGWPMILEMGWGRGS